jgi:hypothetical protein
MPNGMRCRTTRSGAGETGTVEEMEEPPRCANASGIAPGWHWRQGRSRCSPAGLRGNHRRRDRGGSRGVPAHVLPLLRIQG